MASVLVVDDSESIRRGLSLLLRMQGLEACAAEGGAEALDMLAESHPDLILLDMSMPEVDGITVLEQVRQWSHLDDVPIIIYSAAGDEPLKRRAKRLGAAEFIDKGTAPWELLASRISWHLGCNRQAAPANHQSREDLQ